MRARIWIFTVVVAVALAGNLARLSLGIAHTAEDTMRARVAAASTALRGQFDLLDARVAPRAVAMLPDLIEAVRGEDQRAPARPDERALRAAASVLSPEPDLIAVATPQGAIVSRRGHAAQVLDERVQLPLAQTASGALPTPTFATFDNSVYRFAAARVPGATAAVVVGTMIDDRLAAQLKSQIDADVTLLQGSKVVASSLPQGDERALLVRWAAAPGPGYGVLPVRLPLVGTELSGKLPVFAFPYAVRGALVSLDGGVQAAVTVPASPYLAWLGRYQAFYLVGLALFVLFGFVWGLLARAPAGVAQPVIPAPLPQPPPEPDDGVVSPPRRAPRTPSLIGADIGEARGDALNAPDVPWSPGEGPSGEHRVMEPAGAEAAALREVEQESAAVESALSGGTVAPEPVSDGPGAETAAAESAAAEAASPQSAGAEEAAAWAAPAESASSAPEWQMPSLPPDAIAAARRQEPVLGQIQDPLAGGGEPPAAPPVAASPENGSAIAEPPAEAAPTGSVEAGNGSAAAAPEEEDPDVVHWRETYDRFRELKQQLGEPADRLSFEKFAAKLKKNREDLVARHHCKGVRFSVYEKDGRAAIKASAIR